MLLYLNKITQTRYNNYCKYKPIEFPSPDSVEHGFPTGAVPPPVGAGPFHGGSSGARSK